MTKINEMAKAVVPEVVEFRRDLHRHPEPSMKELRTTSRVCEKLDELGISYRRTGDIGVIAEIHGELGEGPTVMLRADMDALSIKEETGLPFASENEGFMHACGHDTHTSMLLGTAKILQELKPTFAGTVRLVFQPGEEVAEGAKYMIAHGAMENVDMAFGLHIQSAWGNAKVGGTITKDGPLFAACDMFKIKVSGKSAHGCIPQAGADALVAASSIVLNLQTMVSREFEPMEPVVVTVGTMHSGDRFNIIAGSAELTGTCRSFNAGIYDKLPTVMERIVKNTAEALKCTAEVEFNRLTRPLINNSEAYRILKGAEAKVIPEDMRFEGKLSTGGEDFAEYMTYAPSVFMQLDAGGIYPQHSCHVQFDESSFANGIAIEVQFALDALEALAKKSH